MIYLPLAMLFLQQPMSIPSAQGSWPAAMVTSRIARQSPFVQKLANAIEHPKPIVIKPIKTIQPPKPEGGKLSRGLSSKASEWDKNDWIGADPTDTPEMDAYFEELNRRRVAEKHACEELVRRGDVAGAKRRFESDLLADPTEWYAAPLFDLEFQHGDVIDAYKLAAAFMKDGRPSVYFQLRASLAAASLGEVYQGQREFCEGFLTSSGKDADIARVLPKGDSPDVVACLSSMALGSMVRYSESFKDAIFYAVNALYIKDAIFYLENALALDPGNAYASSRLADAYADDGYQYSRAVKTLEAGLARSGNGTVHIGLTYSLNLYRSDFAKVGDGKPAFPENVRVPAVKKSDHP